LDVKLGHRVCGLVKQVPAHVGEHLPLCGLQSPFELQEGEGALDNQRGLARRRCFRLDPTVEVAGISRRPPLPQQIRVPRGPFQQLAIRESVPAMARPYSTSKSTVTPSLARLDALMPTTASAVVKSVPVPF